VPSPGELFRETNDNSVAILLSYGTARVLLAGDAEAREKEYVACPYRAYTPGDSMWPVI
jgi:competence protein ComEC